MTRSLLSDAFDHHVWATIRLLDLCAALTDEQLATAVPGTYGSILDTLRHLVGADSGYLDALTSGRHPRVDEEGMDVAELRAAMERDGTAWTELVAADLDPDAMTVRRHADGSETRAPVGIRLAQALHHGTDHRSQVCTALTALGMEPPEIDLWALAAERGAVVEIPASS